MTRDPGAEGTHRRLRNAAIKQTCRGTSDARPGKVLRPTHPNHELNRSLALHGAINLLTPRVLLKGVRHRVMCHPQVRGPQESTLVHVPRVDQRSHASI